MLGLLLATYLTGDAPVKGMMMAMLGLLPGCVGLVLKNAESSAFSFSADEVAAQRAGAAPIKEAADAPK